MAHITNSYLHNDTNKIEKVKEYVPQKRQDFNHRIAFNECYPVGNKENKFQP